jgi:ABC-2 type transport system ATP-binding protein
MNEPIPPVLELLALTRRFGAVTVVDALTFTVAAGEVFGLLGSNGAGKTTTIKMLTTLLEPSSGEARVAGRSILTEPVDVRRSIGYVPQAVSVDGSLTGYENLLIFAKLYDLPGRETATRSTWHGSGTKSARRICPLVWASSPWRIPVSVALSRVFVPPGRRPNQATG